MVLLILLPNIGKTKLIRMKSNSSFILTILIPNLISLEHVHVHVYKIFLFLLNLYNL